jgi:hypothetical protein
LPPQLGIETYGRPEIVIVTMNEKPTLLKNAGPRQNARRLRAGKRIAEIVSGGTYFSQNSLTRQSWLVTVPLPD